MSPRQQLSTVAGIAGFAGILVGLITPVFAMREELTLIRERQVVYAAAMTETRQEMQKLTVEVTRLREALLARGIITQPRGGH